MSVNEARTCDVSGCDSWVADVWVVKGPLSIHDVVLCDEHAGPLGMVLSHGRRHRTDDQSAAAIESQEAQTGLVRRALVQRAALAARQARRAQRVRQAGSST